MAEQVYFGGRAVEPAPRAAAPVDVPAEVFYGRAIGNFVSFVNDQGGGSPDVPDQLSLDGTVILTPLTTVLRYLTTVPPRLAMPQTVVAEVINGELCDPRSRTPGVPLIATYQTNAQPNVCQWRARFQLTGVSRQPLDFVFNVPTDGTVDLGLIADVPPAPGTVLVVSHEDALAAAESAEDAAQSAQDAADYAASGNPGPPGPPGPSGLDELDADELTFAVLDPAGRRSWVEIGLDGHPSAHSAEMLGDTLTPLIESIATSTSGMAPIPLPDSVGYVFALTDNTGRMAYAIRPDGTMDVFKPGAGGVAPGSITTDMLAPEVEARLWPDDYLPVSGPDITCWGDSMTNSSGSVGYNWTDDLGILTGHAVTRRAVGGEPSWAITARQGSIPFLLLPVAGLIAAGTTPVQVTIKDNYGKVIRPLLQGGGGDPFTGSLQGIPGVMTKDASDLYYFTRTTAGVETVCNRPRAFRTDDSYLRRGDILVLWLGQNNAGDDARAITDDLAIIGDMRASEKRWLVISRPSTSETTDKLYSNEFGRRFIAIRRYMVDYGLADRGITPTAQDLTDIGNDIIPTSLRSDATHFNAEGYHCVADQVNRRLRELGWV